MAGPRRDYQAIAQATESYAERPDQMRAVVDALWNGLHNAGVSWVGFYIDHPDQPHDRRMVLGPCRDKPACSPIGLHGLCGQALISRQVQIVRDVRSLGVNYIACDPRDRSEIVAPLIDQAGVCWGVLDLDSWEPAAFDEADAAGLRRVLHAAGLTAIGLEGT